MNVIKLHLVIDVTRYQSYLYYSKSCLLKRNCSVSGSAIWFSRAM